MSYKGEWGPQEESDVMPPSQPYWYKAFHQVTQLKFHFPNWYLLHFILWECNLKFLFQALFSFLESLRANKTKFDLFLLRFQTHPTCIQVYPKTNQAYRLAPYPPMNRLNFHLLMFWGTFKDFHMRFWRFWSSALLSAGSAMLPVMEKLS